MKINYNKISFFIIFINLFSLMLSDIYVRILREEELNYMLSQ